MYTAPRKSAEAMAKVLQVENASIVDMACGTGLVAEQVAIYSVVQKYTSHSLKVTFLTN